MFARCALKENVVVRLAVERRIEIDEIHAFIVDAAPKDREVVAVIEMVH